ncbi:MAG: hypothetical protein BWY75_02045 [bacterium ADurb.Bin425]|nr:MAG: hypothetical protein BWY75_02045 [bacterium ADurb.Bin425]
MLLWFGYSHRRRCITFSQAAKIFLDQFTGFIAIEITDNDQGGITWLIELLIVPFGIIEGKLLHIRRPADGGILIGMPSKGG